MDSLSIKINVSKDTGQDEIRAPIMYKVYVSWLMNMLTNNFYATYTWILPSSSFTDYIIIHYLLNALHPFFLKMFMSICNKYGIKQRYMNLIIILTDSFGIVTLGGVDELYQYKNLMVL